MSAYEVPLGIVLTVFGGIALAVQAGVNASLGNHITKPVAGAGHTCLLSQSPLPVQCYPYAVTAD
jgi:hypothetical protein